MLPMLARDFEPITIGYWRPLLRQLDNLLNQQTVVQDGEREAVPYRYTPRYEVDETAEHYVMSFDVPGVHRDDLDIEITGNQLCISGERKSEGRNGTRYGRFQQLFTLPEGVTAEGIVAEHKDGVLRLAIQKPAAVKAIKVRIADGAAQQREGGFFKNLVSSKKSKNAVEIKGATSKDEPVAMAH